MSSLEKTYPEGHDGPGGGASRHGVGEPGHEDGRQDGGLDALVVVGVDAHVLVLRVERELADVERLELVVRLQVRPAPHAAVDHVGEALAVGNLGNGGMVWNGSMIFWAALYINM